MFSKIKNHTTKKLGATLLATTILIGSVPYASAGNGNHAENPIQNTTQNDLSTEQIEQLLNSAINNYIHRAPDVFEINKTLMEKLDHEIILMSLSQLNRLFTKYEGFTKSFIDYHRKNNTKFTLKFDTSSIYDAMSSKANSISLTPNLTSNSAYIVTAHEFGHIVQYILVNDIYNKLSDQCLVKSALKMYLDLPAIFGFPIADAIKHQIVNGLPDDDTALTPNSTTNAMEYFAEAFTLLELSSLPESILNLPPEYSNLLKRPVLKNLENYLANEEIGYLPKENSKFNK